MTQSNWSVPETEVLRQVGEGLTEEGVVLATVVAVEGSAYRRPGAKMVIAGEGSGVGSITAGCLEDEIRSLAERVAESGTPRLERFDLTNDEDDVWGLGVGCNGVIDVLLEPVDGRFEPLVAARDEKRDVVGVTILDADDVDLKRGARAYWRPTAETDAVDGRVVAFDAPADWPGWLLEAVSGPAADLLEADTSETVTVEGDGAAVEVFVDVVTAPPHLVVFGTGHDVGPMTELAKRLDFRVTIVGFRGAIATEERFPAADEVFATSPAAVREEISFDAGTYAVVMTHNFVDDRLTLAELLKTPVEYVGLMGPRERFEEMREAFADEGRTFEAGELERIYTPTGLDLGGGTPHQIAQSILAEVTAVHHDRTPKHLKEREGPIHDRPSLAAKEN